MVTAALETNSNPRTASPSDDRRILAKFTSGRFVVRVLSLKLTTIAIVSRTNVIQQQNSPLAVKAPSEKAKITRQKSWKKDGLLESKEFGSDSAQRD